MDVIKLVYFKFLATKYILMPLREYSKICTHKTELRKHWKHNYAGQTSHSGGLNLVYITFMQVCVYTNTRHKRM
jgi:hypothetical protein